MGAGHAKPRSLRDDHPVTEVPRLIVPVHIRLDDLRGTCGCAIDMADTDLRGTVGEQTKTGFFEFGFGEHVTATVGTLGDTRVRAGLVGNPEHITEGLVGHGSPPLRRCRTGRPDPQAQVVV